MWSTTVRTCKQIRYLGYVTIHPKYWWLKTTTIIFCLWIYSFGRICWRELVFSPGGICWDNFTGRWRNHFQGDQLVLAAHPTLCPGSVISSIHGPLMWPAWTSSWHDGWPPRVSIQKTWWREELYFVKTSDVIWCHFVKLYGLRKPSLFQRQEM